MYHKKEFGQQAHIYYPFGLRFIQPIKSLQPKGLYRISCPPCSQNKIPLENQKNVRDPLLVLMKVTNWQNATSPSITFGTTLIVQQMQ